MLEGGSHTALIERPEQVNEAVLAFLRRRLVRSPSPAVPESDEPPVTPQT